jgi:hypothetical protein
MVVLQLRADLEKVRLNDRDKEILTRLRHLPLARRPPAGADRPADHDQRSQVRSVAAMNGRRLLAETGPPAEPPVNV